MEGIILGLLPSVIPMVKDFVGKFIDDAEKAKEAQAALVTSLMTMFTSLASASKDVMTGDAQSQSWLTRNARPIVVLWGLAMITLITFSPFLGEGLQHSILESLKATPDRLWDVVSVGIGAYMLARSADKAVTAYSGKR
jgi:hypothetical protein